MKKAVREKRKTAGHFNDLLLPVILVLCVLPFVVYLAEYDTGFSQYNWNSDYSMIPDFYTCYRRSIFLVDAWILCWFTYTRAAIVALFVVAADI